MRPEYYIILAATSMSNLKKPEGEQFKLQCNFEQYKLYVEMAENYGANRISVNKFYVSIITALFAMLSILAAAGGRLTAIQDFQTVIIASVGLVGIILCIGWLLDTRAFIRLKKIKWDIIIDIENKCENLGHCYYREGNTFTNEVEQGILYRILGKKSENRIEIREWWLPLVLTVPWIILITFAVANWLF